MNISIRKTENTNKKLTNIHNGLNENKKYMEKLKEIKKSKVKFKQIIISRYEMGMFEKEELKKGEKIGV